MSALELCLCVNCAKTFYSLTDHNVKRKDYKQIIKGECDICRGRGFDYLVSKVER